MITALITALFVIQLITIFMVVLQYSKLSKFKELEIRQNQLVEEMDNAISVYLMEMKEENDRLIQELKTAKVSIPKTAPVTTQVETSSASSVNAKKIFAELADHEVQVEPINTTVHKEPQEFEPRKFMSVQKAASAYSKQKVQTDDNRELEQVQTEMFTKEPPVMQELSFEQQVIVLYKEGKSIEEIAKMMQRGKTEIELLVKFHA
ncbi:hypothetical protein LZ480_03585 [Solibacillus sp. MA9]|uniref:Coupling factor for flagellin transcription and translation n=1 Tax=Solibacillus palustris TaxID=2908203 RepID=A0ABS9U9E4_9BACL|nr:hypothetical protein [Solibacillus sp. MA9]MCH7320962.1 hypothetical protein [Solibacillus sp. MA9]